MTQAVHGLVSDPTEDREHWERQEAAIRRDRDPFYNEAEFRWGGKVPDWYQNAYGIFREKGIGASFQYLAAIFESNLQTVVMPTVLLDDAGKQELLLFLDALAKCEAKDFEPRMQVREVQHYLMRLRDAKVEGIGDVPYIKEAETRVAVMRAQRDQNTK